MVVMAYAVNGTDPQHEERTLFWRSDVPVASRQILEPKLKLEVNKAGSFSFSIYKNNTAYSLLHPLKTIIEVLDDGEMLFRGRVLDIKRDLFGQRKVTCEGDLTFLLDSFLAPVETTQTVEQFFTRVLSSHDAQVEAFKQFYKGEVTITEKSTSTYFNVSSYTKSSDVLDSELLQVYGGILRTRYANNATALDYIEDPSVDENGFPLNTQGVRYGVNLIEFEEEYPIQDIFTVLLPLGANKLTISSVNSGSVYLENAEAVAKFGRIIRVESWDDISNATTLKNTALKFLNQQAKVYPNDLTVKAVDLRCLDKSNTPIKLMDRVKVVVKPLNIDIVLFCLSIEYDFYNPENNSYKLGTFIPSDKHKGSKKSSRGRGGSGSSRSSRGISSGVSSVSTEVAEFKDQTKENFSLDRANIALKADKNVTIAGQTIELTTLLTNYGTRIKASEDELDLEVVKKNNVISSINLSEEGVNIDGSKISITSSNGNQIISAINLGGDTASIQAAKINLTGYVTADELSATNAQINNLTSGLSTATLLKTEVLEVGTSLIVADGNVMKSATWQTVTKNGFVNTDTVKFLGDRGLNLAHYHSITATAGTGSNYGKIVLTLGSPSNNPGDRTTNFNIADTQFYIDGVSAAKAAMKIALDASNHSISVSENGTISGGSVSSTVSATYDSSTHTYSLSGTAKIGTTTMNTSSGSTDDQAYQDGLADGSVEVTLNYPTWNGNKSTNHSTYTVSASNGLYKSQAVYVAKDSGWSNGSKYIYLVPGSSNINNYVASSSVSIPNPSNWSISYTAQGELVSVTIAGKQFTHTFT